MKKLSILLILVTFYNELILAQCTLNKDNWNLVFEEQFNGTRNDLLQNWTFDNGTVYGVDNSAAVRDENNIVLDGGLAYFHTKKLGTPIIINGKTINYSTSWIRSIIEEFPICESDNTPGGHLFGMFEIRCKLPTTNGLYPAFWLTANNSWPPEIDVFEYNGSVQTNFFSSVHWGPNDAPEGCSNHYIYPYDLTNDFHTFTVVWTPSKITWFFNNKEIKSDNVAEHIPGTPGNFETCKWEKMDMIVNSGLNWPDPQTTTFDPFIVDYVRVYRPQNYTPFTQPWYEFDNYFSNTLIPLYNSTSYKSSQDFLHYPILDIDTTYEVHSSLKACQGGGKYFYRGEFDLLWATYYYDFGQGGHFYSTPLSWSQKVTGDISLALDGGVVFFRENNTLYYHQDGQLRVLTTLPYFYNLSSVTATKDGLGVFYIDGLNHLNFSQRSSLSSHSWSNKIINWTYNVSNSSLAIDPTNSNIVYFKNSNNQLCRVEKSGSSWIETLLSTYTDVEGDIIVHPDGEMIFYRSSGNKLYFYQKNLTGNWVRYPFNALFPWTVGNAVLIDNVYGDIQLTPHPNYKIYYRGTDDRVWVVYYWNGVWRTTPMDWNINNVNGDLQLASLTNPTLCYRDNQNKIRVFTYGTCEILNPACSSYTTKRMGNNLANSSTIINENLTEDIVKIFPNPVDKWLTIKLDTNVEDDISIEIVSSTGGAKKEYISPYYEALKIDMSEYENGVYFIKIYNSQFLKNLKVVKN